MDTFQLFAILAIGCAVLCAIGWIGWGVCDDRLKKQQRVNDEQAVQIDDLKKRIIELKKQVSFMKLEKVNDLSKK